MEYIRRLWHISLSLHERLKYEVPFQLAFCQDHLESLVEDVFHVRLLAFTHVFCDRGLNEGLKLCKRNLSIFVLIDGSTYAIDVVRRVRQGHQLAYEGQQLVLVDEAASVLLKGHKVSVRNNTMETNEWARCPSKRATQIGARSLSRLDYLVDFCKCFAHNILDLVGIGYDGATLLWRVAEIDKLCVLRRRHGPWLVPVGGPGASIYPLFTQKNPLCTRGTNGYLKCTVLWWESFPSIVQKISQSIENPETTQG